MANPPAEFLAKCKARLGHRVMAEFMRIQIEVGEARGELQELRGTVAEVACRYGLAPIAASTHPFGHWRKQSHTDKERYADLANALQATVRLLLICSMHVHVTVEEEDMRPSARYPTLGMRMTDFCTSLEDSLTVAALYQCILAILYRLRTSNQRWRIYPLICVQENRWRARHYGITDSSVDFGPKTRCLMASCWPRLGIWWPRTLRPLGCADEIRHARENLAKGTSAQIRYGSMTRPSRAAPIGRMS